MYSDYSVDIKYDLMRSFIGKSALILSIGFRMEDFFEIVLFIERSLNSWYCQDSFYLAFTALINYYYYYTF